MHFADALTLNLADQFFRSVDHDFLRTQRSIFQTQEAGGVFFFPLEKGQVVSLEKFEHL